MPDYSWFALHPPRHCTLAEVTSMLRPLANRPRIGMTATTPLVICEAWSIGGQVSWRMGVDRRIAGGVPARLAAQLPRLGITPLADNARPVLTLAADLQMRGLANPLRLDTAGSVATGIGAALQGAGNDEAAVVQWLIGPSRERQQRPADFDLAESLGLRPSRQPDATAKRLWTQKTAEPVFACKGRIGAAAVTPARAYAILRGVGDAVKLANNAHAGLRLSKASANKARKLMEVGGQPFTWGCLLNAAELAAVLAWPIGEVDEDLPVIGGHVNAAPISVRLPEKVAADRPGEHIIGESLHPAERGDLVRVPVQTLLHHVAVTGPTGSGKSTLLCGQIIADIAAGRSTLVIEPRGDLITDVLARVPAIMRDRVAVIEPNTQRSVGFNPLASDREQAELRADQFVGLLAEQHGANFGPRTTDVALHAAIAVSRLPDGTLCDIPTLLTNPTFRRRVLEQVGDPLVLGPFFAGFDALSDAERAQHVGPLLNKLRPFTSRPALRRMVGQSSPRLHLDDVFRRPGTVVLVNLNRGLLGAPTASLLGSLFLSQVWSAIQRRAAVPPERRHPVMMVVDEFQDYLGLTGGLDFGDALAQSRGLSVSWTLAHQHLDQLTTAQRAAVFANARSRVVFRPAPGDAKPFAAAMGYGLTGDDLLRLRAFEACAQLHLDGQPSRPFSVRTRPLPPWTGNPDDLRRASAERYGVDGHELDKKLTARWQGTDTTPEGPVGVRRRRSA